MISINVKNSVFAVSFILYLLYNFSAGYNTNDIINDSLQKQQEVVIDVTEYGVIGDGINDDTVSMQRILDISYDTIIIIPSHSVVTTGPLTIPNSNTTLQVDGILQAWNVTPNVLDNIWPKIPPLRTYGYSRDIGLYEQYQPYIYVTNVSNIRITGKGIINGNGQNGWWDIFEHKPSLLKAGRPNLIQIINSYNIVIDKVAMINSPFWTIHPVLCNNIHIHHITIHAPMYSPNVDGIDPDSCTNVIIEYNDISCGDDHIAIKSGLCSTTSSNYNHCTDPIWTSGLYRTENVTIRNNIFRTGMGIAIGSESSGGISNVTIVNNTVGVCKAGHNEPDYSCGWGPALHIKTTITRGNVIENIIYSDNIVYNTSMFILVEMSYQIHNNDDKLPIDYLPTQVRNITFANNQALGSAIGASFACSKHDACHGIYVYNNTIRNVKSDQTPWGCHYVADYIVYDNMPLGLEDCMAKSMNESFVYQQKQKWRF